MEPSHCTSEEAGRDASPGPTAPPDASGGRRPRLGIAWGLAIGAIVVLLIIVGGFVAWQALVVDKIESGSEGGFGQPAPIVVSPAAGGGEKWFTVAPDGSGSLQGWSGGNSASGSSDPGWPAGAVGYFDVGTVGLLDGVTVFHTVPVFLDRDTEVLIGGQPYGKGEYRSVAEAIFGAPSGLQVILDRPLNIEFHRVGASIVADRISAPVETSENPLWH